MFGNSGKRELTFEADAYHKKYQTVIEIEAGRALVNYQFLKDIFQASMMVETNYLVLALETYIIKQRILKKLVSLLKLCI